MSFRFALRLFKLGVNVSCDELFFSQSGIAHSKLRKRMYHETVTKMVQVKTMLHGPPIPRRKQRVENSESVAEMVAEVGAGSSSATAEATSMGDGASSNSPQEENANGGVVEGDPESHVSPSVVEDQEGFDAVLNEMFHELELEGLEDIAVETSVQNVSQVIRKTKLSKIFGPLSVLNETNVDTV